MDTFQVWSNLNRDIPTSWTGTPCNNPFTVHYQQLTSCLKTQSHHCPTGSCLWRLCFTIRVHCPVPGPCVPALTRRNEVAVDQGSPSEHCPYHRRSASSLGRCRLVCCSKAGQLGCQGHGQDPNIQYRRQRGDLSRHHGGNHWKSIRNRDWLPRTADQYLCADEYG